MVSEIITHINANLVLLRLSLGILGGVPQSPGDHQRGQGHLNAHHHLHLAGRIQRGLEKGIGEAEKLCLNFLPSGYLT
jgi:hypothetical protein